MTLYAIERADGLRSVGGYYVAFHTSGKLWATLGHLKSHLTMVRDGRTHDPYAGCRVVELDLREVGSLTLESLGHKL